MAADNQLWTATLDHPPRGSRGMADDVGLISGAPPGRVDRLDFEARDRYRAQVKLP